MNPLVSAAWLAEHTGAVRIVDASFYLPEHDRDAHAEFVAGHIPGALFLDVATLVDASSPLPMTLPPADVIADRLARLGMATGNAIVLYDASSLHSSARAWWMLRIAGVERVAILDGGWAAWRAAFPVERGERADNPRATHRAGTPLQANVSLPDMREIVASGAQIVDARSPGRFAGDEPEPRAGVEPGHMPGARNLHYATLFEADGTWKRGDALRAAFADAGIDLAEPVTATCGSGVTAAVLVFASHLLGHDMALYDGSWSEWGADPTTLKARG